MQSSKTTEVRHALVVRQGDLEYLDASLRKEFSDIRYGTRCEDGTVLRPENLRELLDYENPNFRRLASITVEASSGSPLGDHLEIRLGKADFSLNATGEATLRLHSLDKQQRLEQEIAGRIRDMRPWYSFFTRLPFAVLFPAALLGLVLAINVVSVIQKLRGTYITQPSQPSSVTLTENESYVMQLGVFGILALVGHVFDRFREYISPRVFFCIGKQQHEFKKRQKIVHVIFGVILLGVLINIVSAIIWSSGRG